MRHAHAKHLAHVPGTRAKCPPVLSTTGNTMRTVAARGCAGMGWDSVHSGCREASVGGKESPTVGGLGFGRHEWYVHVAQDLPEA